MTTKPEQIAEAYEHVARVNHYMVGIVEPVTNDELDEAEEILIATQNEIDDVGNARYQTLNLALDLIEHARKEEYK